MSIRVKLSSFLGHFIATHLRIVDSAHFPRDLHSLVKIARAHLVVAIHVRLFSLIDGLERFADGLVEGRVSAACSNHFAGVGSDEAERGADEFAASVLLAILGNLVVVASGYLATYILLSALIFEWKDRRVACRLANN